MEYREIIKKIAEKHNTTPENVEREMQIAIDAAYLNPTPEAKRYQQQVRCAGERPTPEEFIAALATMLAKENVR